MGASANSAYARHRYGQVATPAAQLMPRDTLWALSVILPARGRGQPSTAMHAALSASHADPSTFSLGADHSAGAAAGEVRRLMEQRRWHGPTPMGPACGGMAG